MAICPPVCGKKCNLTLAMSPTCHNTNTIPISCREFFESVVRHNWLSAKYTPVVWTDRQTDGQRDGQRDGRRDGQTESDAYEPTVQYAQVGSKKKKDSKGAVIIYGWGPMQICPPLCNHALCFALPQSCALKSCPLCGGSVQDVYFPPLPRPKFACPEIYAPPPVGPRPPRNKYPTEKLGSFAKLRKYL